MTETLSPAPAGGPAPVVSMRGGWLQSITRPIQAFQLNYVPVVMIYFAYGALGLVDVTRDLWIKEPFANALAACGDQRLAHSALDSENGVRRTRGHRADFRLATQILHHHRSVADGCRSCDPFRCRRALAHLYSPR